MLLTVCPRIEKEITTLRELRAAKMTSLKARLQCAIFMGLALSAPPGLATETEAITTQRDKVNYAIGVNLIGSFKQQGVEIDLDVVMQGMKDAAAGGKLLLSEDELRTAITQYQSKIRQRRPQDVSKAAADNKVEGETFLAGNQKKAGVVTLESGLQYKIIKAGDGKKPTEKDTVECQYRGLFVNGNEFDSSYHDESPALFKVAEMIPGWRQALPLMPVGSKWQLFVPSQLAYGEHGKGGSIGPNTALVFEIELLAVK